MPRLSKEEQENLIGKRFGRLTVLGKSSEKKANSYMWNFICDCGKETTTSLPAVLNGSTKSCGCLRKHLMRSRTNRQLDLSGTRYGKVTVIKPKGISNNYDINYECICDCGRSFTRLQRTLLRGKTTSCGCELYSAFISRYSEPREDVKNPFHNYERNAKKRGMSFELNYTSFYHIVHQNCYYCGKSPEPKKLGKDTYVINGVDRVDNSIGYTEANSVPCCTECNMAKKDMTSDAFIAMAIRISEFQRSKQL